MWFVFGGKDICGAHAYRHLPQAQGNGQGLPHHTTWPPVSTPLLLKQPVALAQWPSSPSAPACDGTNPSQNPREGSGKISCAPRLASCTLLGIPHTARGGKLCQACKPAPSCVQSHLRPPPRPPSHQTQQPASMLTNVRWDLVCQVKFRIYD